MKILYTADLHGNQILVEKLVKLSNYSDTLILGGDLCATHFIPIIDDGSEITLYEFNRAVRLENSKQALIQKEKLFQNGFISWYGSLKNFRKLNKEEYQTKIQEKSLRATLNKLKTSFENILLILGNDDSSALEKNLNKNKNKKVTNLNEKVIKLNGYEFVGFSYVPITPFNTYFELTEFELERRLKPLLSRIKNYSSSVWIFHSPPYNSGLDLTAFGPVGSKSIKHFIQERQPKLFLCGHIHESPNLVKLGKTICINPGSEPNLGLLKAVLIDLNRMRIKLLER